MLQSRDHVLGLALLFACASADDDGTTAASTSASAGTTEATGDSSAGSTATTASTTAGTTSSASTSTTTATDDSDGTGNADDSSTGAPGSECDDPRLVWHSGNKTNYESYPDPGSEECIEFNGCEYVGMFSECENTMPERWVMAHDIAAVFPLGDLGLHRICVRSGDATIVVTVLDTCADSDCDGCCTENLGDADALVDLEKYTNERFGVEDGEVQWADLGPGDPSFDGCN